MSDLNAFTVDLMLCDSAVSAEGKLYIQGGGWDSLTVASLPFVQPRIGLAVSLKVPYGSTNQTHLLRIALEDGDGKVVGLGDPDNPAAPTGIDAQFNVGRPAMLQPGQDQMMTFAINFDRQPFTRAGAYSFAVQIDGEECARATFYINLTTGTLRATGI